MLSFPKYHLPVPAVRKGFAKMTEHSGKQIVRGRLPADSKDRSNYRICVEGRQGSPQHSGMSREPVKTPGSLMKRRTCVPAGIEYVCARPAAGGSALWVALLAAACLLGPAIAPLRAESANAIYKHGQAAEAHEDYDTALDLYQKALAKSPGDPLYKTALYRVRVSASAAHMGKGRKLLEGGDNQGALAEFLHANEADPGNEAATQEIAKLRKAQGDTSNVGETSMQQSPNKREEMEAIGAPVLLKPISNDPLTLHYSADAKVVYQAIGKAAGINVLFDPDYTAKSITVDLTNESLLDALRIVGTMSNTFWRPVTDNTVFVAQNTRQKRTDMEETAVQTFYLTNAWQQNDLTDVQTAIRNVITGIKIYGVPSQNAIVIRGTPDELMLAQMLINDLDKARSEVVVDIAVLEVSKNWERTLGIAWPSSVGVALQPPTSNSNSSTCTTGSTDCTSTSTSPTLYDLSHLKATDFAVTIGSATANLLLTDSNTKILQNPRIRATDAQKATLTVGEKIPIATGSYQTGAATAVVSSLVNTQFQYQDVGVKIEMTPSIHYDHDVTLKIRIEVSSQASSVTISGVTEPIIAQNIVDQVIRLREGEASILGGIQESQDQVSWTGIPGLSSIPVLRYLFGSKDHTITSSDLVFLVVPHIVRTQSLDRANLRTIDTGSGQNVELRRTSGPGTDGVAPKAAPAAPRSSVGVVPGQSAMAAAPAALAQMSASADVNSQSVTAVAANSPGSAAVPPPPGSPPPASAVNLMFSPPSSGSIAAGSTFQVPVVLTGGKDVASVPMQVQYDPAALSLVNVAGGDLLGRDNQAVALVHRDDGQGAVTINAARPPGTAGVSGAGVVCVLSFQAKTAGNTVLSMTRASAVNSAQQSMPAQGQNVTIAVH
jgi:general secretion pathway protein D